MRWLSCKFFELFYRYRTAILDRNAVTDLLVWINELITTTTPLNLSTKPKLSIMELFITNVNRHFVEQKKKGIDRQKKLIEP